ncbi:MAG: discoidin domain-containing protein [Verrucomicrobia bacterium]|nr:discoidin domain-containing protein [Verrucomicrobiota bacterium]
MRISTAFLETVLLSACLVAIGRAEQVRSLAGEWRFALDRADAGLGERWFERALPEKFTLPGSLPAAGIGDDVTVDTQWTGGIADTSFFTAPEYAKYRQPGNVKVPFWLQPEKYYAGAAWFQREIEIPPDWAGQRVVLFLERVHWESRVWVDGRLIGTNHSLSTPHEYDLGIVGPAASLPPGQHTVSIRVDNRRIVDIGENSHGITDHTQGNWNGIVGKIELRTTPLVWIDDLQIKPDAAARTFRVEGVIRNAGEVGPLQHGQVSLLFGPLPAPETTAFTPQPRRLSFPVVWGTESTQFGWSIPAGDLPGLGLWDEFSPQQYQLVAALPNGSTRTVTFGLRDVSTSGTQLTINGRKTFLRGTLECAIFPKTGHPPMEVEEWRRILRVAKSYGLNLLRFHSWCPPEPAFQAADELGMYFQIETCWPNQSTTLGDGKPVDQWVYDETDRILKYYGNHPSFILMAHGNEPGGRNANDWLAKYVEHFKAKDSRRLWTSGSGWPQLPENQFHVTPDPRIQAWGGGLNSRINARPPETTSDYRDYIAARKVPVISHEIGQWCVYPNFDEIPKYTGYLKPRNFEIFRDRLEQNGLGGLAKQFLLASGRLQTLCYKEDIESALRTPGMGGFQLLDLHDFPGQGTALVGVLDPFWEEKGYVTATEYSRFCNATVPLARLKKRVFTTEETLEAEIEVAHFGGTPLTNAVVVWHLQSDEAHLPARNQFDAKTIPAGGLSQVGPIRIALKHVAAPGRYRLVVNAAPTSRSREAPGLSFVNDWDIWVYPAEPKTEPAKDILVTAQFDDAARQHLASGGKLLLTLPGKAVRNFESAPVKLGFSSIFWNTAWTSRQAPTTLGILCDPQHPALAEFPTEFHSNWQWWYLIHRAGALRLDLLPKATEPIVRVIDDWFTARPLGLVVEGKVGAGEVIICGFDLTRDADDPVSRQMRASLLAYMDSPKFAPQTDFTADHIQSLIAPPRQAARKAVRVIHASSEHEGHEAELAIDGDPTTMWHTAWGDLAAGFPHQLTLEFAEPTRLAGLTVLPRQDGNRNGWIKEYAVQVSRDGTRWDPPLAEGTFPATPDLKTARFAQPVTVHAVRLIANSGHVNGPWAAVAELCLLLPP